MYPYEEDNDPKSNVYESDFQIEPGFYSTSESSLSRQEYWSRLPFPSPADHILSEIFTITHLSWVALKGMAHSLIELCNSFTPTHL